MSTGKFTTLARPYALAAFEYATAKNALLEWDTMLKNGATMVQDPTMSLLLTRPDMTQQMLQSIVTDVLSKVLNQDMQHFIALLCLHRRLAILPDIARLFAKYRAAQEKILTVNVIAATELDQTFKRTLHQRLMEHFKQDVSPIYEVDPAIIGGLIVRAGDRVIDGSIRGKLNRLLESL